MRAGHGELQGRFCQWPNPAIGVYQVQPTLVKGAIHHSRGTDPKTHPFLLRKGGNITTAHVTPYVSQRLYKVFDHPIRLGMIDVKAVQLASIPSDDVNLRQFLSLQHHHRGIFEALAGLDRQRANRTSGMNLLRWF